MSLSDIPDLLPTTFVVRRGNEYTCEPVTSNHWDFWTQSDGAKTDSPATITSTATAWEQSDDPMVPNHILMAGTNSPATSTATIWEPFEDNQLSDDLAVPNHILLVDAGRTATCTS